MALTRYAQIALICIATLGAGAGLPQALPNLGDSADMSPGAERRLGDRIARELYRDPDYIDDPVIMAYVQGIWQLLLAAARLRGELPPQLDDSFAWEILLGKDRTVNAFALPGAYLGVHLGLVAVVSSRDELASVLAHELSHVTQRHISRLVSRQGAQAPWMMGALILGALAASKNPGAANAVIVGGQAVALQTQLNFSRDMEREADRVGFGVMTQAGFEPQAFVSMFEKLQQASRLNDSGGFPYLRSHPLTTERMADMQSRVAQGTAAGAVRPPEMEHALVAARARVLSNANVDALRTWSLEVAPARLVRLSAPAQAASLYGATLAAMKLRDFAAARETLAQLRKRADGHVRALRLVRLLDAELALAQADAAGALVAMQDVTDTGRDALLLRAAAHIGTGRPDRAGQAAQSLQTWLADHPRDAQAWQLLAQANASQGRTLAAIRAEAEVNVAQLDYGAALDRLKAAQDLARQGANTDAHIEAAIVDTRTRQVEALVRELAQER
jgi:predicted Zn-dependent protease